MINSKTQIIQYFNSGIKEIKNFKIGIEHEKFLFNNDDNKRVDYSKIKEMFSALLEFGWNPILEKGNIIGLNKGGKNITLEPGNQIELSGEKLNNILQPIHRSMFIESNPSPVKYAARLMNLCDDDVRLPLVKVTEPTKETIKKTLQIAKLI